MDNKTMARLLAETADLLEIDGGRQLPHPQLPPRRRGRRANHRGPDRAAADTARLLEIPGIGKSMAANLQAIAATGTLPQRDELLAKVRRRPAELLKLPGMGPKTVALLWDAAQIGSIDQLAEAIEAGRLAGLPRMGAKQIEKLRKGIEDYRRSAGRFRIDVAEEEAARIAAYLLALKALRRSRRPAPCAAAAKPPATSTCWPPAPPAHRSTPQPPSNTWPPIPASTTSSPRAKTRSASTSSRACRWTCGCCPRPPTALRCNTSPAPRRTMSRSASARSRWATR